MLAALMLLSASCGKTNLPQNGDSGNNICLRTDIDTPAKAEITDANDLTLYVTETSKILFSSRELTPDNATNGIWNTGEKWQSGEYSFFGYAHSAGSGIISNISNNGREFHVTQPAGTPSSDGSNSNFADYLLSYTYNVADGSTRPLVTLQMVHAVSSVELHFVKPAEAAETVVTSASVNNVKFSGTYSVYEHNANSIVWNCTPDDSQTTDYSSNTEMTVPETGSGNDGSVSYYSDESLYFSFLTVQQPVDNVTSPVTIKVDFKIDGIPYSSSFSLDSVQGVSNWMAGTKTRYAIILDSEVRLLGSIVSWKDGGDMEGTLVP